MATSVTALRAVHTPIFQAPSLTEREQHVLVMLADGAEVDEIATALGYADRTVKGIIGVLLGKLGAHNRAHAVANAVRWGWLTLEVTAMEAARQRIEELEARVKFLEIRIEHAQAVLRGERR